MGQKYNFFWTRQLHRTFHMTFTNSQQTTQAGPITPAKNLPFCETFKIQKTMPELFLVLKIFPKFLFQITVLCPPIPIISKITNSMILKHWRKQNKNLI